MKVLHVINSLGIGGAERLLSFLLPALNRIGTCNADLLLITTNNTTTLAEELQSRGVMILPLKESGSLYSPLNVFALKPFFDGRYDIIHGHLFPTQYFLTIAKKLFPSDTKLVFTEHNTSNRRIDSPLYSVIDRVMYLGLDHLVCITEEIRDIYQTYQPRLIGNTTIIHNGLPIKEIQNSHPMDLSTVLSRFSPDKKYILQVAGFRGQKDQETLIQAIALLPSHFICLFAGDGVRRRFCEEKATEYHVDSRIVFLGNRSDVYSLQKSVDYIVLSTHYEGLSLSCIEGMASGKPFLASDVKGVRNLVAGAGVLFNESDPEDLANKILALDKDPSYREVTIKKCLARASEYSIEECALQHYTLYKKLLDEE